MDLGLQGKVVLVTGASEGIGKATAMAFAREGARVAINARRETVLRAAADEIAAATGAEVLAVPADMADLEALPTLVDAVLQRWGRIDVLVNSAGHGPRAPILEITDAQWHQGIDVYLLNVVRPTRLVAPLMVNQGGGAIVNISTAWAFEPSAMFPTSAVARSGLAAFTKIFADEYAARNVRMNNVLPGWIDSLPQTEQRRETVPMQRYGTSEEIAATVAFLASAGAAYITGQNLRVDGGLTRSV